MHDLLNNPWTIIDELADQKTREEFELDDLLVEISLKLIKHRLKYHLTQKDLAVKLGLSQSMVSKLESGEYNPSIEQLWKISKKLGWSLHVFFDEDTIETEIWNENNDELTSDKRIIDLLAEGA